MADHAEKERPKKRFKRKADNQGPKKVNPKKFAKENEIPKGEKGKSAKSGFRSKPGMHRGKDQKYKGKNQQQEKNGKFRKKSFHGDKSNWKALKRKHEGGKFDSTAEAAQKRRKDFKPSDEGEDKPNIWRMKKKERKNFRRQTKDSHEVVVSMKSTYETLRRKDCPKSKKIELIEEVLKLIAGHSHEIIFKHDTGRVVQCCVKYGSADQRRKLFKQFKDDLEELLKSKYSKFFVSKLLKYGTKDERAAVIKCFYGKVRKLIRHKEASAILETLYSEYANTAQKSYLIQEFYGADFALFKSSELDSLAEIIKVDPARKAGIIKFMKDALAPLVDRSVITHSMVHRVLLDFFTIADEKSRTEMIETVREIVVLILHTHDGTRVAMNCLWHGTAKDRKIIMKSFKSYIVKICKEEFGHLVMLALFDAVDDTVLVKKIIFSEIQTSLKEIAMDTYGRKVLLYLLCPRSVPHFHPKTVALLEEGDGNAASKKDVTQRRQELLEGISSSLTQLVVENAHEMLCDKGASQLLLAVFLRCVGDLSGAMTTVADIASEDLDPLSSEEDHVIKDASGHFALKRLVQQDKQRMEAGEKVFFSKVLLDALDPDTLLDWCKVNRGAFVVTSLLESSVPGVAQNVRSQLKSHTSKLAKYKSKGVEVVLKLLKK